MSDIIEAKAVSNGVARIKSEVAMADRAAWNAAIDADILALQANLAADQALLVLDAQALVLATAARDSIKADTMAYSQKYADVKLALTAGQSDSSIAGVLYSFAAPCADKYSKHVMYTNYVSKANYNYQQLNDRIAEYTASIATLNSLKF